MEAKISKWKNSYENDFFEGTYFDFAFRFFFSEITLKQLGLQNYSSYNLFLHSKYE